MLPYCFEQGESGGGGLPSNFISKRLNLLDIRDTPDIVYLEFSGLERGGRAGQGR